MKRYILNKLNKISETVNKKYAEPIKILCVYQNKDKIIATLNFDNEQPDEKQIFHAEDELNQYIEENKIQNIIRGICIDMI